MEHDQQMALLAMGLFRQGQNTGPLPALIVPDSETISLVAVLAEYANVADSNIQHDATRVPDPSAVADPTGLVYVCCFVPKVAHPRPFLALRRGACPYACPQPVRCVSDRRVRWERKRP